MELLIAFAIFVTYSGVREFMYWRQLQKLEELLKARDLHEYYKGNKSATVHDGNKIMKEEPNTIQLDDKHPFDMPADMKVEWEDENAVQQVKIYKN